MPKQGMTEQQVFEHLAEFAGLDYDWRSGKCYAYTFDAGKEAEQVAKRAFLDFMSKNALDMTFFPSVLELENRIVALAASHLGGDQQTSGSFTSGGTESIILAVKSARDYYRKARPDITEPQMVLPATAHAAFHKAAHYLGLEKVVVPVDPVTFCADVEAMRAAVTPRTILLVGSAGSYAHGVVDDIPALGRLALEHGLMLHVDGCIGAFLLPYFKQFGQDTVDFDLSVPGVTSISMDLHKYCYAPKGASVVLYKSPVIRRHQLFACADWTGYTMINATVQSTKGAGPLAGAWAVMHFLGDDGYREIARGLYDATARLVEGIEAMGPFRVLGTPELPLIAFTSDEVNIFQVIDRMNARGWYVQPQLRWGDCPENIHLSVNPANLPHTEALLADLSEVAGQVTAKPGSKVASTVSRLFGHLNPDRIDDGIFNKMIGMAGLDQVDVPDNMADINDIMNALPLPLAERLLVMFVNRLFTPTGTELPPPAEPWIPLQGPRPDLASRPDRGGDSRPGLGAALAHRLGHLGPLAGPAERALRLARGVAHRIPGLCRTRPLV
jgi:glutamate/tyrosine decarboxylase-like PLP-dependent enzyme